jgi:hypothetical protein
MFRPPPRHLRSIPGSPPLFFEFAKESRFVHSWCRGEVWEDFHRAIARSHWRCN